MFIRFTLIALLPIMFAFNNCSSGQEFVGGKQFNKTEVDGQSIEIVTEEEKEEILLHNDNSVNQEDEGDSSSTTAMGSETDSGQSQSDDDSEDSSDSGNVAHNDNNSDGDDDSDSGNVVPDEVITIVQTQEDIIDTPELGESCGNGNGVAKEWICQMPNGDETKRKPLCLPVTAIEAHVREMANSDDAYRATRGYCEPGLNAGNSHADRFEVNEDESEGDNGKSCADGSPGERGRGRGNGRS